MPWLSQFSRFCTTSVRLVSFKILVPTLRVAHERRAQTRRTIALDQSIEIPDAGNHRGALPREDV